MLGNYNAATVCRDVLVNIHASMVWIDGRFAGEFIPPVKSSHSRNGYFPLTAISG